LFNRKKLKKRLNKISIRNILSIRYNPEEKPVFPPISPHDFKTNHSDPIGITTQKLIQNNIKNTLELTNEPISISLSGGIDSTLCLALLRKTLPNKKITAICGIFKKGYDESQTAKKNAKKFQANFKLVNMDSIFTNMPELISISRKPKWNTYQHLIAKEAKKYGSILVTGDGADEVFGGYVFRYRKFNNISRPSDNWKLKTINYLECHNRDWVPDQEFIFSNKIKFNWEKIYKYFKTYF